MRSAGEVAHRTFALALFKYRVGYERDWPQRMESEREVDVVQVDSIVETLTETKLYKSLSKNERLMFQRDLGEWGRSDVLITSWCGENLLALLWALRLANLPPVWQPSVGMETFAFENVERWKAWIAEAILWPAEEIERMSDYLEAVRLRVQTPDGFEGIPWLADKAESFGGNAAIDGDLPIAGKPFRALDATLRNTVRSLALERHRALIWVLGEENNLDAPRPKCERRQPGGILILGFSKSPPLQAARSMSLAQDQIIW